LVTNILLLKTLQLTFRKKDTWLRFSKRTIRRGSGRYL
jgi:hypothetical protein